VRDKACRRQGGARLEAASACAQLELRVVDQIPWRDELIRPLILCEDRPATHRAQETHAPPETVRKLRRRFQQQGMLGLRPDGIEGVPQTPTSSVSAAVIEAMHRLNTRYAGFHARELARLVCYQLGERLGHKTAQRLWQQSPVVTQAALPREDDHTQPDRDQARLQVITLDAPGWENIRLSRFLPVSRPTIAAWITRFATAHLAGLPDNSRAPPAPARKVWLPRMIEVDHLQTRPPAAGQFRLWSLLAHPDMSVRTVARIMALNKEVDDEIPQVRTRGPNLPPQPHPYKASRPHQYWFIDGRMMDVALEGVQWWSLVRLDGDSRTILAGAMAPSEATGAALLVRYTACLRYGAPETLISDRGGAVTSDMFEAVCRRLQIQPRPLVSTPGESDQHLMETHLNIQRRVFDDQFSLTQTPAE
jgi:hypothetical protein